MYPVNLSPDHFKEDLAGEITRIADQSKQLGQRLNKENRDMTKEEVYTQMGHSASVAQSVLKHLDRQK